MTTSSTIFRDWLRSVVPEIETALELSISKGESDSLSEQLREAMAYALLSGGKRIRPGLCLLGTAAEGGAHDSALPAAVACEMIHAYSLIHDDLPCMDDDVLRRGQPTTHVQYGESAAVLAGDALQTLAFRTLAAQQDAPLALAQIRLLTAASGAAGMVGGQQLDMEGEGTTLDLAAIQQIHAGKTGALFAASFLMGVLAAGADPEPWRAYAESLGRLFQISDDLLDATRSTEQLGKTAGKDAEAGKATVVGTLGLEGAQELLRQEVLASSEALAEQGHAKHLEVLRDLPVFLGARGA
ncbi:MAG: polyprenyl synthetase family protein [Planctomycetota bacterium]